MDLLLEWVCKASFLKLLKLVLIMLRDFILRLYSWNVFVFFIGMRNKEGMTQTASEMGHNLSFSDAKEKGTKTEVVKTRQNVFRMLR